MARGVRGDGKDLATGSFAVARGYCVSWHIGSFILGYFSQRNAHTAPQGDMHPLRGHKHFPKESKMEALIKHKKETRLEISFYSGRESDQHHSWFRGEYKEETRWQVRNTHQSPNEVSWRPHRAVPSASKRGKGRLDSTFVCPR